MTQFNITIGHFLPFFANCLITSSYYRIEGDGHTVLEIWKNSKIFKEYQKHQKGGQLGCTAPPPNQFKQLKELINFDKILINYGLTYTNP